MEKYFFLYQSNRPRCKNNSSDAPSFNSSQNTESTVTELLTTALATDGDR